MRAIEVGEDRLLRVVERPSPTPGPGQVTIDVACCGICGSDLHFRDVPALFPPGTVPGHEFSGSIAAVGEEVAGWNAGDRVCVLPFAQCGECAACTSGTEQVCATAIAHGVGLGTGRPGAYAERVVVDARMLFALPDAVDDQAGTLVEPTAVAVHAVARARPAPGEVLAVIGAGPIGLLTALVARDQGVEVVLVSRNPARGAARRSARSHDGRAGWCERDGRCRHVILRGARVRRHGVGGHAGSRARRTAGPGRARRRRSRAVRLRLAARHLQGSRDPRLVHLRPRRLRRGHRVAGRGTDPERRADRRRGRPRERRADLPGIDGPG